MEQFISSAPMIVVIGLLLVGFALLVKGADFFVEGSSSVAKKFKVPSIIIGLTIVAMGTSLPETAVSVSASIANNNAMAISNVIGSNIFNMMVVIGICSMLAVVPVEKETLKRDFPFSVFCAVLLMGLGILGGMSVGRLDGAILLVLFAGFIIFLVREALRAAEAGQEVHSEADEIKMVSMPLAIVYIIGGAIAIAVGGDLTVDTASRIAETLGMSQTLIGLTIVSIGTSLPELVTSVVAARKNEIGMALGNAIGSNVFNILMVVGIASAISPIEMITNNIIDIIVLIVFSLIVWVMAWTKSKLDKKEGFLMVLMYVIYAVCIVLRDM
ncbi:MAG: calcium/sodium antiporter [Agathobacter sp.]|nr:calcium/sodium antiporter [Agathobacter sp.]